MVDLIQTDQDLRAEVMASPAYQERVVHLFELFQASRQYKGNSKSLLVIQAAFAKLLMGWQGKQREFKKEGNQIGIAVVRRLILVLQRIADSIVWRELGYDRALVQLLAEHSKTGFLDDTVLGDFKLAERIIENDGAIVLVNDLTTILRHGDLTVIYPDRRRIDIVENKSGKGSSKSGHTNRQKKFLNDLLSFLNTGTRISKDKTRDYLISVDVPIETHHVVVGETIARAKEAGYYRTIVSDCFAIEAVEMEHPSAFLPKERPFRNVEHTLSTGNLDKGIFDTAASRIAPYGIFTFDDRTCFNLITGSAQLITTINFDALKGLFAQFGLKLELPQPSQQEIETYLSASIAERNKAQKQDRLSWSIIRDGEYFQRISPDNWGRISLELVHERSFVQSRKYVMNRLKDWNISEDKTTRLYIRYQNEGSIWS